MTPTNRKAALSAVRELVKLPPPVLAGAIMEALELEGDASVFVYPHLLIDSLHKLAEEH